MIKIKHCAICGKEVARLKNHVKHYHKDITYKDYFDRYIDTSSHKCPYCNNDLVWSSKIGYYLKTCDSKNCNSKYRSEHNGGGTKDSLEKIKKTKIAKYGSLENANKVIHERSKSSIREKYGVDNPFQAEEVKEKIKQTNIELYGSPIPYAFGGTLYEELILEKYGTVDINNLPEISDKRKKTCLERYGAETPLESKIVRDKISKTINANPDYYKNMGATIRKTCLEKYGVDNVSKVEEFKEKRQATMLNKFGKTTNLALPENRNFLNFFIIENNTKIYFDSIPEVLFYYWCKENNKIISRESISIAYYIDNIKHIYYPDFMVDNKLYEIKRDDCINELGQVLDYKTKAVLLEKSNAMKEHNVIIIKASDIYIKYFPTNGKDLIEEVRQFRKNKSKK